MWFYHSHSTALLVFSVGNGVRAPLLAVVSTYVNTSLETGRLFTIMSVTDAFSHMVGDPLVQTIWRAALKLQGPWLMLPFFVISVSPPCTHTVLRNLLTSVKDILAVAFALSFALPDTGQDRSETATDRTNDENAPLLRS